MKIKGIDGQQVVDKFQHNLIHSEALLKLYPDLTIAAKPTANSVNEIEYFSTIIASEVDSCDFVKENPVTYFYTHVAHPYKKVKINCSKCDGIIRVNSYPNSIPIFVEQEVYRANFINEFVITCFVYEDLFERHNFNRKALSETQLYIISKLDEHSKKNTKIDLFGLSNSIKLLLPFS